MNFTDVKTLGDLKKINYTPKSIKTELRDNLINKIKHKQPVFEGIFGYNDTVIPELQRAILSMHNINLLGLRGQAKTKIARLMIELLDDYIPAIENSELNEDPLSPITKQSIDLIKEMGDATPISWIHKNNRYTEKLATPDVSIADLIGDIDPIKAANLKLHYSDDRVIHFGLIPRSHRCIFVINELPDLQARIQVSLLNILQEGDIQIRGFKIRLPLDIQFIFTANPEDYTNRGSIITPLKDRIDSQIITHYPLDIEAGKAITKQETKIKKGQEHIQIPDILRNLIELIAIEGRNNEFVDPKSGVSARLTISAMENLISAAERRMLLNNETEGQIRISDLWAIIPAITGKVELVYEGEQEGPQIVAQNLISRAIRAEFIKYFPEPTQKDLKTYAAIVNWFDEGKWLELYFDMTQKEFSAILYSIPGLYEFLSNEKYNHLKGEEIIFMELIIYGLAEYSQISRQKTSNKVSFKDLMDTMIGDIDFNDLSDE